MKTRRLYKVQSIIMMISMLMSLQVLTSAQSGTDLAGSNIRAWEQLKYGMFIHFNMNTFAGAEYDNGKMPAGSFNPTDLDVDQWVRIASDAGMKYAVLTAKHTGGFCLWDSKVTWKGKEYDYDIATSGYREDIVSMFMESCRKFGIKPALYYCLWDDHNEPVSTREEYFQFAKDQITELVTNYKGLVEIWIDIPSRITQNQRIELYNIVKTMQPDCLVTCNNGFTDGSVLSFFPADITNGERTLPPVTGHRPVREIDGKKYYIPMEVCQTINQNWFLLPGDITKSIRTLYYWYNESVKRGANLLLDVPPDKTGRISQGMADRLMELKEIINKPDLLPPLKTFTGYKPASASSVFENYAGYLPEYAVDEDPNTRWVAQTRDSLPVLTIDMGEKKRFNTIVLMEPYDSHITEFEIQCFRSDKWETLLKGTTVGPLLSKKIPYATSRRIRIVISKFKTGENPSNAISVPGVPPPIEGVTLSEFQVY